MRAPQTGRWMRHKAQTEGCIAALLHRYPVTPGRALPRIRRGRCLHRPANPAMPQTPSGGRDRPPYKAATSGRRHKKRQPFARSDRGPMQASAPTQRGDTSRLSSAHYACCPRLCRLFTLHCRAGVHARRGALPYRYPANTLAGPCPASVGDDACIVPQTLRCRRPQAAGEIARPTRHPQAGGDTKSGSPLPCPPAGRCKHRPLRRGGRSTTVNRPPCLLSPVMPPVYFAL